MKRDTEDFLIEVYKVTKRQGDVEKIKNLVTSLPNAGPDINSVLKDLDEKAWRNAKLQVNKKGQLIQKSIFAGVIIVVFSILALILYQMYLRDAFGIQQRVVGTYTPSATPITPSPTSTPTFIPTPTPTFLPTAIPASAFLVSDITTLYPAVPAGADFAWVLDQNRLLSEPALTDAAVWTPAKSEDPASNARDYFYTTTGGASIAWQMDVPVDSGLYAFYVLDTLKNSTGAQIFAVMLDGQQASPYRGQSDVLFGEGKQKTDDWLPLGFYEVSGGQTLSVQATIGSLPKDTSFAVDRLLVLKISDRQRPMIDALPTGRVLASLVDDQRAVYLLQFTEKPSLEQGVPYNDSSAWNDTYRSLDLKAWDQNTYGNEIWVDWNPLGKLSAGEYELYVWIPAQHATAIVDFKLFVEKGELKRSTDATLNMKDVTGAWKSMGSWSLPDDSSVRVRMVVNRKSQTAGEGNVEIGVDAVALVRVAP